MTPPAALCGLAAWGLCAIAASPALPADDPALYPAAQCAALWFGYDDYAAVSPFLEPNPADAALAEAFRQVALRQTTGSAADIDAFITEQRPLMAFLVETYIYGGDRVNRDLYERLMQTCSDFAATQPETRDLR